MGTKSAPTPLGVAILGLGRAGKIHLNVLQSRTDVRLLYLVDTAHDHGVHHAPLGATLTDDINKPLNDERVQIVIVATPTQTHASLVLDALAAGKHVFAEKPLTCDETEIPTMFEMAAKQGRCLFTAFNRRHDPRILAAREKLRSGAMGKVFSATLVSRDYPYPPSAYIATCGNLFKDCVVHDLDYLLWILDDLPTHLIARASTSNDQRSMGAWENSEVRLTLGSGAQATLVNSRLSQSSYDHRLDVYCERGIVQVTNPLEQGLTFADRFDDSYHAQMGEFLERVRATDAGDCSQMTNMSHERTEYLNKLLNSCETSVATGSTILLAGDAALDTSTGPTVCRSTSSNASTRGEASEPDCGGLRVYDEDVTTDRVKAHYRTMRHMQSLAHVKRLRAKYDVLGTNRMGIWAALQALESYVDVSDPDVDLPNSAHCFQTAEGLRAAKQPDWLQLVGLIHDVGKMIFLRGCDEDGTSVAQQWSVVGDTFVVGCPLPSCTIFPAFNRLHPDSYDSPTGVYEPGCGLDQVYCAYGHDEYLYQVLSQNEGVKLPREAMYIIRYHSLYPWHEDGAYEELESPYDRSMKGWVKIFNQYDLYTKRNTPYTEGELAAMHTYYDGLIKKYLPEELAW